MSLHRDTREQLDGGLEPCRSGIGEPFVYNLGFEITTNFECAGGSFRDGFEIWWDACSVRYRWADCPRPWSALAPARILVQEAFALVAGTAILERALSGRYVGVILGQAPVVWDRLVRKTIDGPMLFPVRNWI